MSEEDEEGEREEYCSRISAISRISAGRGREEKREIREQKILIPTLTGCHDHPSRAFDVFFFRLRARRAYAINANASSRLAQTVPDSTPDWFAW